MRERSGRSSRTRGHVHGFANISALFVRHCQRRSESALIFVVAMTNDNTSAIEASSPPSPRTIAWVWVLYFLTGILGTLLTRGIIVTTDAASTANNILTHAS